MGVRPLSPVYRKAMTLRRTNSDDPDFVLLEGRLNEFLAVLNGEQDAFYAHLNRTDSLGTVVVAYGEEGPMGIGAFRPVDGDTVEIKRMFVEPFGRGRGTGASILAELEMWAAELEFARAILETSRRLTPAVGLYRRSGYTTIPNYGAYAGVEDSVCMEKPLRAIQI